jgi:hypothetical protein
MDWAPPPLATHLLLWENQKPPRNPKQRIHNDVFDLLSWSPSSQSRNVYDVFKNIFCFVFYFYFGKNQKEDGWRGIINDKQAAPLFSSSSPDCERWDFRKGKGREEANTSGKESNAELQMRKCVWVMRKRENQHSSSSFVFFLLSSDRRYEQEPNWWAQDTGAPESNSPSAQRAGFREVRKDETVIESRLQLVYSI